MKGPLQRELFALQDINYKKFQCRLMPTVPEETVIGVRMPVLRRLAKEWEQKGNFADFLCELPHRYYEENNLHGLLISDLNDYDETIKALDLFLPYVDNWATCDLLSPKVFRNHPEQLPQKIKEWIQSDHLYTIRFGLGMLMSFYLEEDFQEVYLEWAALVHSEEYYVKMMVAWYFATALAKQYAVAVSYLERERLETWTHNKTIQKATESYRITSEQKAYLRTLRRKG